MKFQKLWFYKLSLAQCLALCALTLILFKLIAPPSSVFAQTKKIYVEETEFFVAIDDLENRLVYKSTRVPLVPDHVCYGWRFRLSGVDGLVKFKEIFTLPKEPEFWGGESNAYSPNVISKDRHTSVLEKFVIPKDGWISNSWCVAEGDPEGAYSMEVFINGEFVKRFDFSVSSIFE